MPVNQGFFEIINLFSIKYKATIIQSTDLLLKMHKQRLKCRCYLFHFRKIFQSRVIY